MVEPLSQAQIAPEVFRKLFGDKCATTAPARNIHVFVHCGMIYSPGAFRGWRG